MIAETRKADEYFLHLERRFMMGLRSQDHSMRKWVLLLLLLWLLVLLGSAL